MLVFMKLHPLGHALICNSLLHLFIAHLHFGFGEHQVQGKLIRKDPVLNPASHDH